MLGGVHLLFIIVRERDHGEERTKISRKAVEMLPAPGFQLI